MEEEKRQDRITETKQIIEDDWDDATPDNTWLDFGCEWDPDYMEAWLTGHWGFFKADEPRHLDHKTREMIVAGVLACRDRPGAYTHAKNAIKHGASVNDLLEVFSVAVGAGGSPTLMVGLDSLRRIVNEESSHSPIDRDWKYSVRKEMEEVKNNTSETREEKINRITNKIQNDMGYKDEAIEYGINLDPDFFEVNSRVYWGFFEGKNGHLDPIARMMVIIVIMAYRGMSEELYENTKKAMKLGATEMQLLEAFEVCVTPGGLIVLHEGLRALKRINDEKE